MSSKQSNFFSVRTEANRNSICFGCFSVCFAKAKNIFFRFVSVFRTSIETTETNRIFSKQTETNLKNLQKTFSIGGVLKTVNFFFRFEPKLNLFQLFFGLLFRETNKFFFRLIRFVSMCGPVSKQPKQIELMVWRIKKVDILPNLLLFRLVFCFFRLFRNTETPCFDIKAKQAKQTSFGSSFGCFDTKLFSEDTLEAASVSVLFSPMLSYFCVHL